MISERKKVSCALELSLTSRFLRRLSVVKSIPVFCFTYSQESVIMLEDLDVQFDLLFLSL